MINDYVTPIINTKGERYYMVTYHFYRKIMNEVYNKLYEMHPLKYHISNVLIINKIFLYNLIFFEYS